MKFISLAVLILLAIFLPLSAFSQPPAGSAKDAAPQSKKADSKKPGLQQILDSYYNAIGGLERWQQLNTMVMKGTITSQGVTMPITAYHQRPNKCRVEFRIKEDLMAQVYNGMFAWQINPLSGNPDPTPMSQSRSNYLNDTCDIESSLIDYQKKGHKVKFMGEEKVGNATAYKVNIRYRTRNIETYYLDTETYLPIKTEAIYNMEGNELRTTAKYADFKKTNGYVVPYRITIDIHGAPSTEILKINEFIFNPKINGGMFDFPKDKIQNMPKEIKPLKKK